LTFYDDPVLLDRVTPDLRLFRCLALCMTEKADQALEAACRVIPDMEADDFKDGSQARILFHNVLQANIDRAFKLEGDARRDVLAQVRQTLLALPDWVPSSFTQGCLAELEEAVAIVESQEMVKKSDFAGARESIRRLPETDEGAKKRKQALLE